MIEQEGLVEDYIDLETQLTPNGFDVTVDKVEEFESRGKIDFSNSEREISETEAIEPVKEDSGDDYGWWDLEPGSYKVRINERVDIPNDLVGIVFPRSSLLRCGAFNHHGVWDAGYEGGIVFILKVENPEGLRIKENARVAQVVFMGQEEVGKGYEGKFKA